MRHEREMSVNILSLPTQYLPIIYQDYLQFFDVLDKAYCFITKNKLRSSITTLCQLCSQLILVTDLASKTSWNSIQRQHLLVINSFNPNEFKLVDPMVKDGLGSSDAHIDFVFSTYPGIGQAQSKNRRQVLLHAMWNLVANDFICKTHTKSTVDEVLKKVKKSGWPSEYDANSCSLPSLEENSTNIAPSSSSVEGSTSSEPSPADDSNDTSTKHSNSPEKGSFSDIIQHLKNCEFYNNQIKHVIKFPGKEVCFEDLADPIPVYIQQRLKDHLRIEKLYRHQTRAINAIRQRKHVVVSTSTSSGKSLIYNIPVFEAMLEDPKVTALYLFPTKALSQDQLRSIVEFVGNTQTSIVPVVCDGDTNHANRMAIQQGFGNLFLTNPDMIHHTLLPDVSFST